MLQSLSETPGQATGLPFRRNAFEAWIDRVLKGESKDSEIIDTVLSNLKVRFQVLR
jgi:hypothetical protein